MMCGVVCMMCGVEDWASFMSDFGQYGLFNFFSLLLFLDYSVPHHICWGFECEGAVMIYKLFI